MRSSREEERRCSVCGGPTTHWLRAQEVADALGCSVRKAYYLLDRGELRGIRVGRSRRFEHKSIDGYVNAQLRVEAA